MFSDAFIGLRGGGVREMTARELEVEGPEREKAEIESIELSSESTEDEVDLLASGAETSSFPSLLT